MDEMNEVLTPENGAEIEANVAGEETDEVYDYFEDAGENDASEERENTEEVAQPPESNESKTFTQTDVDRIFAERKQELRKEFTREHKNEIDFANRVKQMLEIEDLTDAESFVLDRQAAALAEKTGWTVDEAKQKIQARIAYTVPQPTKEDTEYMDTMLRQVQDVEKRFGVNMVEIIQNNAEFADKFNRKEADVKDLYIEYMQKQNTKPKAPKVEKRATSGKVRGTGILSDKDVDRIDELLSLGRKVRID